MSATGNPVMEKTPDPLRWDKSGYHTARNFDVVAYSEQHALSLVSQRKGITRGSLYHSTYGETPDQAMFCQSMIVSPAPAAPVGSQGRYFVKAMYERSSTEPIPGGPPIYRVRGSSISKPVDYDANLQPILNSVDEPIDPPLTIQQHVENLKVTWWAENTDQIALQASLRPYRGALNAVKWQGADAGEMMCHGIEIADDIDGYFKLEADFEFRDTIFNNQFPSFVTFVEKLANGNVETVNSFPGFYELHVDRGKRKINGAGDDFVPIIADGSPVTEPRRLNSLTQLPIDVDSNDVYVIGVKMYSKTARFADLGI